jgi:hypothetical protein
VRRPSRCALRGKRARQQRREQRERAAALDAGTVEATREEKTAALRRKRDAALAAAAIQYQREVHVLQQALANTRKKIQEQFERALAAINTADSVALAEADRQLGIIVAPANTDLDAVAGELDRLTGRR